MKYTVFLICCFLIFNSNAQETASVSGRIYNETTKEFLPFSTITLTDKTTGRLISGAVSDQEGRFEMQGIAPGEYLIRFSFMGFEDMQEEILIGELNRNFDLGKIELKPASEELDEVTVLAQKSAVSAGMEKKTFSLDENIAQSGGSVLDAMRTMPGVTVDQEGKIILRGSDRVVVLMDGKQSSLTGFGNQKGLDNIPASNIDRIEIINNPSAKYDAAGMAGIINIVYKKEKKKGFNGDAGFAYGIGALSKPKDDLPTDLGSYSKKSQSSPTLNKNYRTDKTNFFLQSEILHQKRLPNNEFTTRYYDDGRIIHSQVPENRSQTHYIFKGGMDVFVDENNSFTFSGIYDWESHVDTAQVPYINMSSGQRYRYTTWREEEVTGFMNYLANYKHNFAETGHELMANIQYTRGWEDETYHINDSSEIRQGRDVTNILATEHTTSFMIDYVRPLPAGRLEGGTKLQVRRLPVDFTVQRGENSVIYPGLGDWSKWGENIYAGYINFVYEKLKYDVEAGLRAEQTDVFYNIDPANIYYDENDSYSYFELFPNIRLTYKLNENNRISVFYNRRIDRPGEPELRIYPKSDDQELLKIGNPYLRPQLTQSAELAYKKLWDSGSVFLSGYYRVIDNPFMRVYTIDSLNADYDVIIKSYANTGRATNSGLEFILSQQIFDFWKMSGNINFYKNVIDPFTGTLLFPYEHTFTINKSIDNTWDMKISNQFTLPNEFQIQLTAVYYAPKNIPQGRQLSRYSVDAGIKKAIMKGRGEITCSASDILNKFGIRQEIDGDGFHALYENYYETQVFRVGFKYKF